MREKTLYIMCGAPGSGKTWFAKQRLITGPGWFYVSRDEVRFSIIKEEEDYFSHEEEVYVEFVSQITKGLKDADIYYVVADATHLNWASRHKHINRLSLAGLGLNEIHIIPIVVESNIEDMLKRNEERSGRSVVPRSVLRRMTYSMTDPKEDEFNYTAIMYVDNAIHHYVEKE